jgi:hypothetical protein
MPGPAAILATILRAWGAAVVRLPSTLRKRSAFWRAAPTRPADALALLREHPLSDSDLSLR